MNARGWLLVLGFGIAVAASSCDSTPESCVEVCEFVELAGGYDLPCLYESFEERGFDTTTPECEELSDAYEAGDGSPSQCHACMNSMGAGESSCDLAIGDCLGNGNGNGPGAESAD